MDDISGKRVAILVDNYFEESEFIGPLRDLQAAGATVDVVAPKIGKVHGMRHVEHGNSYEADTALGTVHVDDYDALVLPGGAVNADSLRMNKQARVWVRQFLKTGKPVAAICHAPWLLASAGMAEGRRLTSYQTIQDDMRNAGATWIDAEVVIDRSLITSRSPDDVPAFGNALITMLQTA